MSKALLDYNAPLMDDERQFAAENHDIIYKVLQKCSRNIDEYYGVAAIGYLKAVKSYVNRPELQVYAFSTIAFRKISHELYRSKEHKQESQRRKNIYDYDGGDDSFDLLTVIADPTDGYAAVRDGEEIRQIFSILSETERRIFILMNEGCTQTEIAAATGYKSQIDVSRAILRARRRIKSRFGGGDTVKTKGADNNMGFNTKIDYDKVKQLYEQGLSDRDIAEQVGCDRASVREWRKRCGLPSNEELAADILPSTFAPVIDTRINMLMKMAKADDEPEVLKYLTAAAEALSNQQIRRHFKRVSKGAGNV